MFQRKKLESKNPKSKAMKITSSSAQQQDSDQLGFGHDSGGTRSSKRSSSYNESPLFLSRILRRNMANVFLPSSLRRVRVGAAGRQHLILQRLRSILFKSRRHHRHFTSLSSELLFTSCSLLFSSSLLLWALSLAPWLGSVRGCGGLLKLKAVLDFLLYLGLYSKEIGNNLVVHEMMQLQPSTCVD